jgi:TRAP-type mannitol/chloroaromatic compound transport system substrate-binding protein
MATFKISTIKLITNGRFQITPSPEGEIVTGLAVFEAVSDSTVECGHTAGYYYVAKNSAFAFATITHKF